MEVWQWAGSVCAPKIVKVDTRVKGLALGHGPHVGSAGVIAPLGWIAARRGVIWYVNANERGVENMATDELVTCIVHNWSVHPVPVQVGSLAGANGAPSMQVGFVGAAIVSLVACDPSVYPKVKRHIAVVNVSDVKVAWKEGRGPEQCKVPYRYFL